MTVSYAAELTPLRSHLSTKIVQKLSKKTTLSKLAKILQNFLSRKRKSYCLQRCVSDFIDFDKGILV